MAGSLSVERMEISVDRRLVVVDVELSRGCIVPVLAAHEYGNPLDCFRGIPMA